MTQEALRMALKALEVSTDWDVNATGKQLKSMQAITALRKALAQTQEPEAWMYQEYRDDDQFGWRDEILFTPPPNDPNYFRNIVPVYTTPPKQEPRNFCPRCGKRTADLTVIHTCTPPRELEMT